MNSNIEKLKKKLERQIVARETAENLLENKTREVFYINQKLERQFKEMSLLFSITNLADDEDSSSQDNTYKYLMQNFIDFICKTMHWKIGHIYTVEGNTLNSSLIWTGTAIDQYKNFVDVTNNTSFALGEGLPGICLAKKESVWVEDIAVNKGSPRSVEIESSNLHAAFATPIFLEKEIFAIAEFFFTESLLKDKYMLKIVDNASKQLGIIMQKRKNAIELQRKNEELSSTIEKLENTQALLVQQEKMASLGVMAAGVAHEINNPISFITGNMDVIAEYANATKILVDNIKGVIEQDKPDKKNQLLAETKKIILEEDFDFIIDDFAAIILSSKDGLMRVRDIVANLREFSRIDSKSEYEIVDIHSCIERTLQIVNNEIKYHCEIIKKFGNIPAIEINIGKINQVLTNLTINASHSISEHGIIEIETMYDNNNAFISVKDNGCGISAQDIDKIFDPFFTTKPVGKGTGLGLSMSKGIIEEHGGSLTVESKLGEGTKFVISLPISQDSHSSN